MGIQSYRHACVSILIEYNLVTATTASTIYIDIIKAIFSKQTFRKNVVAWKNGAGWREFRRKTERTTKKYHETEGKWHCFLQKTSNDAIRRNSAQKTPLAPHAIVQYFFLARPQLQVQYTLTCMPNNHRFPTCQHKYRVTVAFRPNGMSLAKGFCWGLGFAGLVASWCVRSRGLIVVGSRLCSLCRSMGNHAPMIWPHWSATGPHFNPTADQGQVSGEHHFDPTPLG